MYLFLNELHEILLYVSKQRDELAKAKLEFSRITKLKYVDS